LIQQQEEEINQLESEIKALGRILESEAETEEQTKTLLEH